MRFLFAWIGLAALVFIVNLKIVAPYGRHTSKKWGPLINNRLGWFAMELIALLSTSYFTFVGRFDLNWSSYLFYGLYAIHYVNRAFIFPFRIRDEKKKMPLVIMVLAMVFNAINGFFIGHFLSLNPAFSFKGIQAVCFLLGIYFFIYGAYVNVKSDNILLHLKDGSEKRYKIPRGFKFEIISCPNHYGEMMEWIGFALLSLNPGALAFACWTAANLIPRALAHHKWYKASFTDYPKNRKAIIPHLL